MSMTPVNIVGAFKRCGIVPLSLEVMLKGCVGDVAVDNTTPMISLALNNICITNRVSVKWTRAGFAPDALKIVCANVDRLVGTLVESSCRKSKGVFLPDELTKKLPSGGYLVTAEESLRVMDMHQADKASKVEQQREKKTERLRKKTLKLTQKLTGTPNRKEKQVFEVVI